MFGAGFNGSPGLSPLAVMADFWEFLLRYLHVLAGTLWMGSTVFLATIHLPWARRARGAAGFEAHWGVTRSANNLVGGLGFVTTILGLGSALSEFGTANLFTWADRGGSEGGLAFAGAVLALSALALWFVHRAPLRRLDAFMGEKWSPEAQAGAERAYRNLAHLMSVEASALVVALALMVAAGMGGLQA